MEKFLERIYLLSRLLNRLINGRDNMSLCAKAREDSLTQGSTTRVEKLFDRLFWFDPDHCKTSYLHYRLDRLSHNKGKFK